MNDRQCASANKVITQFLAADLSSDLGHRGNFGHKLQRDFRELGIDSYDKLMACDLILSKIKLLNSMYDPSIHSEECSH